MTTATDAKTKLPRINTSLPGPKSQLVIDYDHKFMSPSYMRDYPLVADHAYGCIVEDPDGNTFLDFAAGIAVCSTGHCHPKVVRPSRSKPPK
jgi:4-aminobutyrate aminotransferase and related aminotransferases